MPVVTWRIVLMTSDVLVSLCGLVLASAIRWGPTEVYARWNALYEHPLLVFALYGVVLTGVFYFFQLYDFNRVWSYSTELRLVSTATIVVTILIALSIVALKLEGMSRLVLGSWLTLQFLSHLAIRFLARFLLGLRARNPARLRQSLIVGTGPKAVDLAKRLVGFQRTQYSLNGFLNVSDHEVTEDLEEIPVVGHISDLAELLHSQIIDDVFVALPFSKMAQIEDAVQMCEAEGKTIHFVMGSGESSLIRSKPEVLLGVPMMSLSQGPERAFGLLLKRLIDIMGASTLLLLSAPIFLVIVLAIKLDSKGPVFFKQQRVGLHGRRFTLYKFRSMVVDAEQRLEALKKYNEQSGPVFKMRNDPRITTVGRLIRKTSLDELPQLVNVLKGEMSLVGPRPPLPAEIADYEPWQRRRLSVTPGITCVWQVSARNEVSFEEWVRMDLHYIDHWSLWEDFRILFKTIPSVIKGTGM